MHWIGAVLLLLLGLLAPGQAQDYVNGRTLGRYFTFNSATASPGNLLYIRNDATVDLAWGTGSPNPIVPADFFWAEWTGELTVPQTGKYTFFAGSDDGIRFYLDDALVVQFWGYRAFGTTASGPVQLTAGVWYKFKVQFFEGGGAAAARMAWSFNGGAVAVWDPKFLRVPVSVVVTESIQLLDSVGSKTFIVYITAAPTAEVRVTLKSQLPLSTCLVIFNATNWNIPAVVTVYSDANAFGTGVTTYPVTATTASSDPKYVGKTGQGVVSRTNGPSATATSWGDPHFVTFDGTRFNLYTIGDYYFVRQLNSEFVVQTRQNKCNSVSCNYGVAIKFRTSVFYVFLTANGVPSTHANGDLSKNGITVANENNNQFTFHTQTGIKVVVKPSYWSGGNIYYLNIDVTIPSLLRGQVRGLAGNFDGNSANDYVLPGGTTTSVFNTFQSSWLVPSSANLFLSASATIPTLPSSTVLPAGATYVSRFECGFTSVKGDDITKDIVSKANTTLPSEITDVTFDPDFEPSPPSFGDDTDLKNRANATCSRFFLTGSLPQACNPLGVNGKSYFDECMFDFSLTGDDSFVIDAVNAYIKECASKGAQQGTTPGGDNGGDLQCPNFCNGKGTCQDGVCACNPGFTGSDCSERPNVGARVTSITSIPAGSCDQKIQITGDNFFTSVKFECEFEGSVNVTATVVSRWLMTCPIPSQLPGDVDFFLYRNGVRLSSPLVFSRPPCCSHTCQNGATCIPATKSFSCQCRTGYNGTNCEQYWNSCSSSPCPGGTVCTNTLNNYTCACPLPTQLRPNCVACQAILPATISLASGKADFQVVLSGQVSSTVTVYLTSDCAVLTKCVLSFTTLNWNSPQSVTAFPNYAFTGSCRLNATLVSTDSRCNGLVSSAMIQPGNAVKYCGYAYGDPHYRTMDGNYYNYFGIGDYYFARQLNSEFVIQARQGACYQASCQFGLAVKFRSTVLYVYVNKASGAIASDLVGNAQRDGLTITYNNRVFTITTTSGIQVRITGNYWAGPRIYYFDADLCLTNLYFGQVAGLVGYFDGKASNDYTKPDGTVAGANVFAPTWAVATSENLFLNATAVIPPLQGGTLISSSSASACKPYVPPNDISQALRNKNSTSSPVKNETVPSGPTAPSDCTTTTNATLRALALATCDPYFNSSVALCCKQNEKIAGVEASSEQYYSSCLCDFILTQDTSFALSSVQAFYNGCKNLQQNVNGLTACKPCPNSCSNAGTCSGNGVCTCNPGFAGDDCSENWNNPPSPASVTPNFLALGCPQSLTFTISGHDFYGNNLFCRIGSTNLRAAKVSDNEIVCTLPALPAGLTSASNLTILVIRNQTISVASVVVRFFESCCSSPCKNGGACVGQPQSPTYSCTCTGGFTGKNCEVLPPCELIITPQPIIISLDGTKSVQLVLKNQVANPVTVTLVSTCAFFSTCSITFTPSNWNVPQTITAFPNMLDTTTSCPLVATLSGDSRCSGKTVTVQVQKVAPKLKCGHAYGDPHFLTLDGNYFNFFGIGDYVFAREIGSGLVIQTRQAPCYNAACHTAIVVKFSSTKFYLYIDQRSGVPRTSIVGNATQDGVIITAKGKIYSVTTPSGAQITLTVNYWAYTALYYIDLDLCVPGCFSGQLFGLSGFYDGNPSNDARLPDGTTTTNANVFFEAWRVPAGQNLFLSSDAVIPALGPNGNGCWVDKICTPPPLPPNVLPNKNETSSPVKNDTVPSGPAAPSDCSTTNKTLADLAVAACAPVFNDTVADCCKTITNTADHFYAACLCDFVLSENYAFVLSNLNSFYKSCAVNGKNIDETCNSCPKACHQRGSCKPDGTCVCDQGFSGDDCGNDESVPPHVTHVGPAKLAWKCLQSNTIFLTGEGFFGTNLTCVFSNGQTSPGLPVSDNEASCDLPFVPSGPGQVGVSLRRGAVVSSPPQVITFYTSCCAGPCQANEGCVGAPDDEEYSCVPLPCKLESSPSITFSTNPTKAVTVTLSGTVTSTVTVTLQSSCAFLSTCTLTFTPGTLGTRTITAIGNANNAANCTITATATGGGCSGKTSITTVVKIPPSKTNAMSWGDPHIQSYGRTTFTSVARGDFYLIRQTNSEFVVQVRQTACGEASCNTAVVVRFRSTVVFVTLQLQTGVPVASVVGSTAAVGIVITSSGSSFTINLPTGTSLRISTVSAADTYFLGIQVTVTPTYLNQLVGLLGYYNEDPSISTLLLDGTINPTLAQLEAEFSIPDAENLFLNHQAVIPVVLTGASDAKIPAFDTSCSNFAATGDIGASLTVAANSPLNAVATPAPATKQATCTFTNPTVEAAANAACRSFFTDSLATCCKAAGVSPDTFLGTCLCDFNLLGSGALTLDSVQAFYDQCTLQTQKQGTTCKVCPRACSSQGTCNSGVCACLPGFKGVDCSENWNAAPTILSIDKPTVGRNCPSSIVISGTNFFGSSSNLRCNFNGISAFPVRLSNFQVRCPVPTTFGAGVSSVTVTVTRSGSVSNSLTLNLVDSCCSNPCLNGGRCLGDRTGANTDFTCNCTSTGYTGNKCQTLLDFCASSPCLNEGVCSNIFRGFSCSCVKPGWTGPTCGSRIICAAVTQDNAAWPPAPSLSTSFGTCASGYFGTPSRVCQTSGSFGPITNPCRPIAGTCPAETYGTATYPSTAAGTQVNGTCIPGFSGSPQRQCNKDGTWATLVNFHCTRNSCPQITENEATFPGVLSLTNSTGTCPTGKFGTPYRLCQGNGSWGPILGAPCTAVGNCPANTYKRAFWAETAPGATATGVCVAPRTGAPTRICKPNGTWQDLVNNHCA